MKIIGLIFILIFSVSSLQAKDFKEILDQSPPELADQILVNYGDSMNMLSVLSRIEDKNPSYRADQLYVLRTYLRNTTKEALEAAKKLRSQREDFKSQYGYFCRILNYDIPTYIRDNKITKEEINKDGLHEIFIDAIKFCEDLKTSNEVDEEYSIRGLGN
ncbi:hypothetical protein [Acinetobacter modestus]|uniref:hypothetical protein n=1 Tax=Acinetobacter modestus TaxID=1776740 RepID=UPI001F4A6179|nr:hypothetical protein [Acinetobacter modestus]MCH7329552.1 hypothetical protein [Acinetobacter modestus]